MDWWADTDERRRRDEWRDGPTEKSLREWGWDEEKQRGLSIPPETSELGFQISGHLPVDCQSRCSHSNNTDLKLLEKLGTIQQAQVLVNRLIIVLLFSTKELILEAKAFFVLSEYLSNDFTFFVWRKELGFENFLRMLRHWLVFNNFTLHYCWEFSHFTSSTNVWILIEWHVPAFQLLILVGRI